MTADTLKTQELEPISMYFYPGVISLNPSMKRGLDVLSFYPLLWNLLSQLRE